MRKLKNIVFAAALVLALGLLSACSFESKVNYVYKNGEKYTAGDREITEKIEKIDIHYLSGDVKLLASETGVVTIKETSEKALDEKLKVHTWVDGTTLYVRYCASAKGLSLNNLKKQLVITIPSDGALGDLKVDVSSADFTCDVSVSDQVKINTTSGDVNATVATKKDPSSWFFQRHYAKPDRRQRGDQAGDFFRQHHRTNGERNEAQHLRKLR